MDDPLRTGNLYCLQHKRVEYMGEEIVGRTGSMSGLDMFQTYRQAENKQKEYNKRGAQRS